MRRIVVALFVLSLAACDEAEESPPVVRAAESGTACNAGSRFYADEVEPWLERDGGSRTQDLGCSYVTEFLLEELPQEVVAEFNSACLGLPSECAEPLEDDVPWTDAVCDACDNATCLDLLDPDGRC